MIELMGTAGEDLGVEVELGFGGGCGWFGGLEVLLE